MADFLKKIQGGLTNTKERAKVMSESVKESSETAISLSKAKSEKKNLLAEKEKKLCFLGMNVYRLYQENKVFHEEMEDDITLLKEIDNRLDELEEQIVLLSGLCSCGAKPAKDALFCPNCGKRLKNIVICGCGAELSPDVKFCVKCGAPVPSFEKQEEQPKSITEIKNCICGAEIHAGQTMCMECGRLVE